MRPREYSVKVGRYDCVVHIYLSLTTHCQPLLETGYLDSQPVVLSNTSIFMKDPVLNYPSLLHVIHVSGWTDNLVI